jgi:hypothetical protein
MVSMLVRHRAPIVSGVVNGRRTGSNSCRDILPLLTQATISTPGSNNITDPGSGMFCGVQHKSGGVE